MKTFLIFSILVCFFSQISISQVTYVEGSIEEDIVWSGDTVKITGNVILADYVTLIIEPGIVVEFQGEYDFSVFGSIIARGLPNDSIVFTMNDTSGYYLADTITGGWKGFSFVGMPMEADSSVFEYCVFEFSKASDYFSEDYSKTCGGVFFINSFSNLEIKNCCFRNNTAYGNGGAIWSANSDIIISDNTFINNKGIAHGGAICTDNGNVEISRNLFFGNYTGG